jgi:hypothetical protein
MSKPATSAELAQAVEKIKREIERGSKRGYSFWTGILIGVALGLLWLQQSGA